MTQKSYDERIEELQKRQEQLKAQEKALKKRASEEERRKRAKRLIEMGAIVESVLGRPTDEEDRVRFLAILRKLESNENSFSKVMNENKGKNKPGEQAP